MDKNYIIIFLLFIITICVLLFNTYKSSTNIVKLEQKNDSLIRNIRIRDIAITKLDNDLIIYKNKEASYDTIINNRNEVIIRIKKDIIDINKNIVNTDSLISKNNKKMYEEINTVNGYVDNDINNFFTNYFK